MSLTVSSCQTDIPTFKNYDVCSPFFEEVEEELYKIHCFCAPYDLNQGKTLGDYVSVEVNRCNKNQGFSNTDFFKGIEPTIHEIVNWYNDLTNKEVRSDKIQKDSVRIRPPHALLPQGHDQVFDGLEEEI